MIVKSRLVEKQIGKNIGICFDEEKRCKPNPYCNDCSQCFWREVCSDLKNKVQKIKDLEAPAAEATLNPSIIISSLLARCSSVSFLRLLLIIKTSEVVSLLLYTTLEVYTNFRIESLVQLDELFVIKPLITQDPAPMAIIQSAFSLNRIFQRKHGHTRKMLPVYQAQHRRHIHTYRQD